MASGAPLPPGQDGALAPDPGITELLNRAGGGDSAAEEEVYQRIYHELRQLASGYLRREGPGHTLQATAVVNEMYLRLVKNAGADWKTRGHFFAVAARTIRYLLIEHARGKRRAKRGGGRPVHSLMDGDAVSRQSQVDPLDVDEALQKLAELHPRQSKVLELRYFAGLTIEQVAQHLRVSERTVESDWLLARIFLKRQLEGREGQG